MDCGNLQDRTTFTVIINILFYSLSNNEAIHDAFNQLLNKPRLNRLQKLTSHLSRQYQLHTSLNYPETISTLISLSLYARIST